MTDVSTDLNSTASDAPQSQNPRRFLFLLASTRINGNSEQLAREAAANLPAEVQQVWLRLADLEMPPFADIRHLGDGHYPSPVGVMAQLLQETLAATDIVFVTPLYWYSLPTMAKLYLDHWSGWMRIPELHFMRRMAGKKMWNVTVTSDEDQSFAAPLIDALHYSSDYAEMVWGGALVGYGSRPGDVMRDQKALRLAKTFFA